MKNFTPKAWMLPQPVLIYKIPKIDVISEHQDEIFISVLDF